VHRENTTQTPKFLCGNSEWEKLWKMGEKIHYINVITGILYEGWMECLQVYPGLGFFSPLLVEGKVVYVLNCAKLLGGCNYTIKM